MNQFEPRCQMQNVGIRCRIAREARMFYLLESGRSVKRDLFSVFSSFITAYS